MCPPTQLNPPVRPEPTRWPGAMPAAAAPQVIDMLMNYTATVRFS